MYLTSPKRAFSAFHHTLWLAKRGTRAIYHYCPESRDTHVMPKSREELKKLLDALDARMPSLIQANPLETEFWQAFWCASDGITGDAGPFDYDWLLIRVDRILESHGKIPSVDLLYGVGGL